MKREIVEWIRALSFAIILGIVITSFVKCTKVYGSSMNPTLKDGDILITYSIKNNINRGDIVIFNTNLKIDKEDSEKLNIINRWKIGEYKKLIKRVIAVEGDSLIIRNGNVILNGIKIDEEYISGNITPGNVYIEEIPQGKVFVMGDNRINSLDSRSSALGLVDKDDIVAKVIVKVYPFSEFKIFK